MDQPNERYYELAEKWLNGTITAEERKEFSDWYHAGQDAPLNIPGQFAMSEEELRQRILHTIQTTKSKENTSSSLWNNPYIRIAAASVAALSLGLGIYYFAHHSRQASAPAMPLARTDTPAIKPGGNKAVLTLNNGSTVVLDTAGNGMIVKEPGARIIKLADGRLTYEAAAATSNAIAYNTLATPRGGKYNITLEDGTKVWLNAASSLRFPTSFTGKERIVELTGEGYFEVAKAPSNSPPAGGGGKKIPFIVNILPSIGGLGRGRVEVLGTHFNINAYSDEEKIKTTLLEGKVKVTVPGIKSETVLMPGEQSVISPSTGGGRGEAVDTEEAVAWKNDLFRFEQADMKSIMRQLARWYNIDVSFEQDIPGHFSATISRSEPLEKVFHMLELTGSVHFTLKGRQALVHK